MIHIKMRRILLFVLLFGVSASSYSYFSRFLDIAKNSREYQLLLSPDSFSLKEGGLIASGVNPTNIQPYFVQMKNIVDEIKININTSDKKEKSSRIFDFMHKKMLIKYKRSSTTLDVALKKGEYNCLSSTLLYNILMEESGIKAQTMVLPTHTYTLLTFSTNIIEVENTTPMGYDVANNSEAQRSLKKLTGFSYSDAIKIGEVVGKRGLLAYTYANRAYFADKAGLQYLAFQNALKAYALYPQGKNIYTNVSAGFSSYSYYLINKQEYNKAMDILEEAITHFPVKNDFLQNYKAALDRYLNQLVEQGKYELAVNTFENAQKVTDTNLPSIQESLFSRMLYRLINQDKDFVSAYKYAKFIYRKMSFSKNIQSLLVNGLDALYKQNILLWKNFPKGEDIFIEWYGLMMNDKIFRTILESYYSNIGLKFYKNGDLKKGMELINRGLTFLPASDILRSNGAFMTGKTAISYLNKKDYCKGIYYINLTLKYLPYDKQMLNNLKISYQEWAYSYIDQKKYTTALKIVEQGLKDIPNDIKLMEYQRYIKKKLK